MSELREISISPSEERLRSAERTKTDADIRTLVTLRDYAQDRGYAFVLSAGYAVDAHRGGEITRAHGDMDVIFFLPDTLDRMSVQEELSELLQQEVTRWKPFKLSDDYLEYREEDETKSVYDQRVLEVDLYSEEDKIDTTQGLLRDSTGREHSFEISGVNSLIVGKVSILNSLGTMTKEERQSEGYREMEEHDREDFLTLLNNSAFDKGAVINSLTAYAPYELDDEEAFAFARMMWENALEIIGFQTK